MAGESIAVEEVAVAATVAAPMVADKRRLGLYLFGGLLMLMLNVGDPSLGLINIPASFFLKNRLHLGADQQAIFRLCTGIPLYLSLVFGFLRDRWSPFGRGDAGHLVVFGLATAVAYAVIAFLPATYRIWMGGIILATSIFQIVAGAGAGLLSTVGQQRAMAGRMSALIGIAFTAPPILSNLAGARSATSSKARARLPRRARSTWSPRP